MPSAVISPSGVLGGVTGNSPFGIELSTFPSALEHNTEEDNDDVDEDDDDNDDEEAEDDMDAMVVITRDCAALMAATTDDGTDTRCTAGIEPGIMETVLSWWEPDEASRALRASLFLLDDGDRLGRKLSTLGRDVPPFKFPPPLLTGTTDAGTRENVDFPDTGTSATLVPGLTSKGGAARSSFWPAETMTGAGLAATVLEEAVTAIAVAMWGLGRMERKPGAFWECWATTITIGCCCTACWESLPSSSLGFLDTEKWKLSKNKLSNTWN